MITENLSTLKIHKLTQEQYERELSAGNIDGSALYLTPDEEITLEQIGAAPAGYGLGEFAATGVTDCNELTKNGWYSTTATADNIPNLFDGTECVIFVMSNGVSIMQIGFCHEYTVAFVRFNTKNVWTNWQEIITRNGLSDELYRYVESVQYIGDLEALSASKAPSGYGLGDSARVVVNPNDAIQSGFYALAGSSSTDYFPEYTNFAYGTMLVENRYDKYIKQTFYFDGIMAVRNGTRINTSDPVVWDSLEFINPPLAVGVEYRTTERSEGKPVYVKRISVTCDNDISALSDSVNIYFPHNISSFGRLVRCNAVMNSIYPLPHISHRSNGSASIISINNVNVDNIAVTAINIDRAAPSFVFDIAYCKYI